MRDASDVLSLVEKTAVPFEPTEDEQTKTTTDNATEFVPFPVDALPGLLSEFVRQASKSIGCDESLVVNPLMAAISGAIGNARQVELKADWHEPCTLWAMNIAHSGDKKSPPFRRIKSFFNKIEQRSRDDYEVELSAYKAKIVYYKAELHKWSKKGSGNPPDEPIEPIRVRYVITDTTAEAVANNLSGNPRGLILMRDELAGWFGSFGQYKSGNADAPFWLECYDGGTYSVDRKGSKKIIDVSRCSISLAGTIQPATMKRFLADRIAVENGMLARFLLSLPPERKTQWTDAVIDDGLLCDVQAMFDDLLSLGFYVDSNEKEHPENVYLSGDARELFKGVENQYGLEKLNCHPDLKSYWSKTPGRIARIALQHHCVRLVTGESVHPTIIDTDSMLSAITMGRWHSNEASRVYGLLGCGSENSDARELREILDVIRALGGAASIPEIYGKLKKYRDERGREKLEKILLSRVKEGEMRMESPDTGGRGTVRFILLE